MVWTWIAQYYKWLILLLCLVIFSKIFLNFIYSIKIRGFGDILFILIKWYNKDTIENIESKEYRSYMRAQNFFSIVMYCTIGVIIIVNFVKNYLIH